MSRPAKPAPTRAEANDAIDRIFEARSLAAVLRNAPKDDSGVGVLLLNGITIVVSEIEARLNHAARLLGQEVS